MTQYKLVLMHGNREAEGTHYFEGPDDLLTRSAETVMRAALDAMEHEVHEVNIGHIDHELYSAQNDMETGVVTALGHLVFHGDQQEPFSATISKA